MAAKREKPAELVTKLRLAEVLQGQGDDPSARLSCLPPYRPDFNPIEMAFAKLKGLPRRVAERTVNGLWRAIGHLVDVFTSQECANDFAAAGYDAD